MAIRGVTFRSAGKPAFSSRADECWLPSPSCVHLPALTLEVSIAYRVLEVFPQGRRVVITCHSQMHPPVTYSLWGSRDIEVSQKVVRTRDPVSFHINVTLKSRPDLLTYTCQASTTQGLRQASTTLQMYWELWASECRGSRGRCGEQGLGVEAWGLGAWGWARGVHLPGPLSVPWGLVTGVTGGV